MLGARRSSPDILELRIHGVLNSPPTQMLGVPQDQLRRVTGDTLAAFYTPAPANPDDGSTDAVGAVPPEGIRREAYSWGGLDRYAPTLGGGILGKIGLVLTQLAWVLLSPFGLCNCAYWARELPVPTSEPASARPPKPGWRGGKGAGAVRLFALILTLLYVSSFASVSLDLVGIQCFPQTTHQVCAQLPSFMDGMADWSRGGRLAALSLVPIVAILVLYVIAARARVTYEANIAAGHIDWDTIPAGGDGPQNPMLATPRFWRHRFLSVATERLHVAGAFALVGLLLFWDRAYSQQVNCWKVTSAVTSSCVGTAFSQNTAAAVGVCAATGWLLVVVVWTLKRTSASRDVRTSTALVRKQRATAGRPKNSPGDAEQTATPIDQLHDPWTAWILVVAVIVFAAAAGLDAFVPTAPAPLADGNTQPILGLTVLPLTLAALAVGLAVSGLTWRRHLPTIASFPLYLVFAVGAIGVVLSRAKGTPSWLAGAGGAAMAAALVAWAAALALSAARIPKSALAFRYQGWRGAGPGVIMMLALGALALLASLLVVGFGAWLALPIAGGATSGMWRGTGPKPTTPITTPTAYALFGDALLIALTLTLVIAGLFVVARLSRLRVLTSARSGAASGSRLPTYGDRSSLAQFVGVGGVSRLLRNPPPKPPPLAIMPPHPAQLVIRGRRLAAMMHVGEAIAGILATLLALAISMTLLWSIYRAVFLPGVANGTCPPARWLTIGCVAQFADTTSIWALSAIAIAGITAIIAATGTSHDRPIALLWDLICFLPRAGHPFGPPCYAERAVPELQARVEEWLNPPSSSTAARRRVILSAHSQGAVLAVAVLLSLKADGRQADIERIGLLTYGIQLRPYFGRFLPELLGPDVVGGTPTRGPSLAMTDPWFRQVTHDHEVAMPPPQGAAVPVAPVSAADPVTVRTLLTVLRRGAWTIRWISLWRRTDFLGFPVDSYGDNPIDTGAEELDRSTYMLAVATHSNYPATPAYAASLATLARRLR